VLQDVAAERAVISAICKYGSSAYVDIADIINSPNSFTIDSNQIIFKCLQHIYEQDINSKIDIPLILSAAKSLGVDSFLSEKHEREHLRAMFNFPVLSESAVKMAAKVKKLEIGRLLDDKLDEIKYEVGKLSGDESVDHILALVENPILDFSNSLSGSTNDTKLLFADIEEYLDYVENIQREMIGISSGYPIYDMAIGGGFRRKTVNLIGARLKTGKSQYAINCGLFVTKFLNIPVLYLDTEMGQEDHIHRILANLSSVPINEIECGKYKDKEKERIRGAAKELKSLPFYYRNIAGAKFEEIISHIRRWVLQTVGKNENGDTNDCLIIYDYIKLMDSESLSSSLQEYQALGFQMTTLTNFAIKYNLPILSFIQLNRDGINSESTASASGSDRLLWFCSNFSIYKRKSDDELQSDGLENGTHKLVPIVCRHGGGLNDREYINFLMEGKYGRIKELGTNFQLKKKEFKVVDDGKNEDVAF